MKSDAGWSMMTRDTRIITLMVTTHTSTSRSLQSSKSSTQNYSIYSVLYLD